jgi:hypothetical protein
VEEASSVEEASPAEQRRSLGSRRLVLLRHLRVRVSKMTIECDYISSKQMETHISPRRSWCSLTPATPALPTLRVVFASKPGPVASQCACLCGEYSQYHIGGNEPQPRTHIVT